MNKKMKNNKEYLSTEAKRHLIICEIAKGTRYTDVVKKFMEEWNLSRKTVEMAVDDAVKFMRSESTKETIIAMNMQRLDSIISDSMQEGDKKNAIKAIDTQNKLAGGYTEKVKIEGDSEINLVFDIGE